MVYQSYALTKTPRKERFDHFSAVVDDLFSPALCQQLTQPKKFSAHVDAADLGDVKIASVSSSALSVQRRPQDIAKISSAPFLVKFQMAGESLFSQRGNDAHLRPGDFVIGSAAEPYNLRFDGPYQMSVLAVASSTMQRMMRNPEDILGRRMPASDPCCSLLSSFVANVVEKMPELPVQMAERVETNILDLLGGVIGTHTDKQHTQRKPALEQLLNVKGYVRDNLRNRRLGPAMIAEALGVSTRYVHKLFASEPTTLARYIRALRLQGCHDMLLDAEHQSMSITEIALHWGFYDLSHMTRAFSKKYGIAPSALRSG